MHEIAIIEGILATIKRQKEKHNFTKVISIELVCGKYNCASSENLKFSFETAVKDTYLQGSQLSINRLPEKFSCLDCHQEFNKEKDDDFVCPSCRSNNIMPLLNNEIYLNKLEVE